MKSKAFEILRDHYIDKKQRRTKYFSPVGLRT